MSELTAVGRSPSTAPALASLTGTSGVAVASPTTTVSSPSGTPADSTTASIAPRTETPATAAQKGKEFNLGEFLKMFLPALGALMMGPGGAALGSLLGIFAGKNVGTVGIDYTPPGGGGSATQPAAAAPEAPATPAAPPAVTAPAASAPQTTEGSAGAEREAEASKLTNPVCA